MSYTFRQSNENEVMALTQMSEAAFQSDKEFGGSDGGPTGYDNIPQDGTYTVSVSGKEAKGHIIFYIE